MKPVLDATAGNRHMYGRNKYPDNVVFMDKELGLRIPPHVFAVWKYLPFRNNVFHCARVDPPHVFSLSSMYNQNPKARPNGSKKIAGWYGAFASKREAVIQIHGMQKEMARVTERMCFKWNEASLNLENILSVFDHWIIQLISPVKALRSVKTFWVKMTINKQTKRMESV